MEGKSFIVGTVDLVDCRFARSWSIWPSDVAMESGRKRVMYVMLRPGQVRKLLFLIARRKLQGVGLKQHRRRYWINSVFVLSLVMMARALCWMGFFIGMSQSPSSRFLCPCITTRDSFMTWILFLSRMKTQSSSQSCPREIRDALWRSSKTWVLVAETVRKSGKGRRPKAVAEMVELSGSWTVAPWEVVCISRSVCASVFLH